jgi:tetratricopeptide (TPR) repeat protein
MAEQAEQSFLNVPELLERSMPRHRGGWFWYATGIFALMVLLSTYAGTQMAEGRDLVEFLSGLGMMVVVVGMAMLFVMTVKAVNREEQRIEAIEELMQLRRWAEAAGTVQALLERPTRTPRARVQGLIYLAAVLGRYGRYGDGIAVYDYLLGLDVLDAETTYGLRLGRAMSMLHEDRLFDVDKAIGDLRRSRDGQESAGLAVVDIYRDVKTGHPQEAIEIFERRLPVMREQLGQRVADAHALAARAYDMLGREADARRAYENATLLSPEVELQRRYPEVRALVGKYPAAAMPAAVGAAAPATGEAAA